MACGWPHCWWHRALRAGHGLLFRDYTPEWQIAFGKPGLLATGECAVVRHGTTTTHEFRPPRGTH